MCKYTTSRDFLQAKHNSEINAGFLLNEQGDLHFLLHDFGVQFIIFNGKKIEKMLGRKKI